MRPENLLKDIDLFLLDMDGTIYHEDTLIDGALTFFERLKIKGKSYAFMTNNSSKSKEAYLDKLNKLGIPAESENIVSSVTVTIDYLKSNYKTGIKLYLVGTDSFKKELEDNGYEVVPVDYREKDIEVCVLGFDTELTYAKLQGLCYYVSRDYEYIATNCDIRCPVKNNKFIPDCGSMAQMIEASTGRKPLFLGKPAPEIVYIASKRFCVPISKIMCVGDRLYTDVAVGNNAGAKSALVLSGEARLQDLSNSRFIPTFTFRDIKEMADFL